MPAIDARLGVDSQYPSKASFALRAGNNRALLGGLLLPWSTKPGPRQIGSIEVQLEEEMSLRVGERNGSYSRRMIWDLQLEGKMRLTVGERNGSYHRREKFVLQWV